MDIRFIIGVLLALSAGVSTFIGQVLQKKAINELPANLLNNKLKFLIKNRVWLLGLILYIVIATIFYILAELLIGPVLIPGLMSFGLVALVLVSRKIVYEKIGKEKILGMIMLSIGVIAISASKLVVNYKNVKIEQSDLIRRIIIFTISTVFLWLIFELFTYLSKTKKVVFKSLAAGFPYVLSNFFIFPLYVSANELLNGRQSFIIWLFFIVSCIILIIVNILGITELQTAYQYGKVTLVASVQQIPIQTAPLFYYYVVFNSLSQKSILLITSGIFLIIASGFLLSADLENKWE